MILLGGFFIEVIVMFDSGWIFENVRLFINFYLLR